MSRRSMTGAQIRAALAKRDADTAELLVNRRVAPRPEPNPEPTPETSPETTTSQAPHERPSTKEQ